MRREVWLGGRNRYQAERRGRRALMHAGTGMPRSTRLIAEHDNTSIKDATHKALSAAKSLGRPVHILVAGANCRAVAEAAARLDGVEKVLLVDAPAYQHFLSSEERRVGKECVCTSRSRWST